MWSSWINSISFPSARTESIAINAMNCILGLFLLQWWTFFFSLLNSFGIQYSGILVITFDSVFSIFFSILSELKSLGKIRVMNISRDIQKLYYLTRVVQKSFFCSRKWSCFETSANVLSICLTDLQSSGVTFLLKIEFSVPHQTQHERSMIEFIGWSSESRYEVRNCILLGRTRGTQQQWQLLTSSNLGRVSMA